MIIVVNYNKQKIKITLMEPNIDQLHKQVQENLKLPFDFELQDKQNNTDFKLEDKLEVYVSHQYSAKRVRIKSLNLVNVKRDSCSEFSTGNEKSSINEVFKLQQEYRVEQNKINREGNKLIQQIKKRMQMQDDIIKMRENILTLPELEKKKVIIILIQIILAQKRELSKPIRFDILAEHEKKYEEQKLEKQKLKEIEKIQWLEEQKTKQIRFPKSKALIRLEVELSRLKQQQLLQNEQKKIIRFKKYGEKVSKELPHHHSCSPIKNSSIQTQQLEIAKKNILRLQNLLGEKELFVIKESLNEIRPRGQNSLFEINKSQSRKPQTSEHINYKQQRKSLGIFQSDDPSSQSLQMDQVKGLEQKIDRSSQGSVKQTDSQIKQHLS